MGIKPGDSGVVIGYQVYKLTCTCSVEWFGPQSQIYLCSTGDMSTLTHSPLEPGCEDYSFLDQAVEDFQHCLDSTFTNSANTSELVEFIYEADAGLS